MSWVSLMGKEETNSKPHTARTKSQNPTCSSQHHYLNFCLFQMLENDKNILQNVHYWLKYFSLVCGMSFPQSRFFLSERVNPSMQAYCRSVPRVFRQLMAKSCSSPPPSRRQLWDTNLLHGTQTPNPRTCMAPEHWRVYQVLVFTPLSVTYLELEL